MTECIKSAKAKQQITGNVLIAAIIENVITLCVWAVIVIFAPGAWKWAGFACLLNINNIKIDRGAQ